MSHTGNANGNFGIEGLKNSRFLTPFVAAQNLRNVLHCWYNADFLQIDSNGLVSGATDLTGQANNGTQPTAGSRMTFFPRDLLFGGLPSFGNLLGGGIRHMLITNNISLQLGSYIIVSTYYSNGLASTFSTTSGLLAGGLSAGVSRVAGGGGSATWSSLLTAGSTFSKNGGEYFTLAASAPVLPLPASTLTMRNGTADISRRWLFGTQEGSNRNWIGGYRNIILTNSSIGAAEVALIEGVIAWDGGHQKELVSTHPYRYCPPRIRD
jgi:hypothetical protein